MKRQAPWGGFPKALDPEIKDGNHLGPLRLARP
jgi:hypothetical protein